jgi:hypothetical protein
MVAKVLESVPDQILLGSSDSRLCVSFFDTLLNFMRHKEVSDNTPPLLPVAITIELLLSSRHFQKEDDETKIKIVSSAVREVLVRNKKEGSSKLLAIENLCTDIFEKITSLKDFQVLALTCEKIMVPINNALKEIPSDDRTFVESIAKAVLDSKGAKGLANIINILDDIGSKGCITAERQQIIQAFGNLRQSVQSILNEEELDIILTAFCQEFERRVGQKRKGRAGRGTEGTTSIILNYFGINATHAPEHFTTGLEVDKWIRTKDGWTIGISCKRTLRERWKQAYTTDMDLLSRHKIRSLWHVITYDNDLSDEKITEIGSHRAILYLPDDSPRLRNALQHPGMKNYVRPMTRFIDDLKALV